MVKCRICKGKLFKIVDLGKISLVGNFTKKKQNKKNIKFQLIFALIVNMYKLQKF